MTAIKHFLNKKQGLHALWVWVTTPSKPPAREQCYSFCIILRLNCLIVIFLSSPSFKRGIHQETGNLFNFGISSKGRRCNSDADPNLYVYWWRIHLILDHFRIEPTQLTFFCDSYLYSTIFQFILIPSYKFLTFIFIFKIYHFRVEPTQLTIFLKFIFIP